MKTALVTGAARGIGKAAADALQKAGLRVLRLDLEGELAYDLTNLAGIAPLVESLGEIHVLVNNAGVQTAVAHFGNDPQWKICRPPLIELDQKQEQALITELKAAGFTMPGLAG